ncbi:hypothetical protein HDE_01961 [Halotydeus destructor]|nr:hypothetical protein HDE_01961 [Halotydeus destructor]
MIPIVLVITLLSVCFCEQQIVELSAGSSLNSSPSTSSGTGFGPEQNSKLSDRAGEQLDRPMVGGLNVVGQPTGPLGGFNGLPMQPGAMGNFNTIPQGPGGYGGGYPGGPGGGFGSGLGGGLGSFFSNLFGGGMGSAVGQGMGPGMSPGMGYGGYQSPGMSNRPGCQPSCRRSCPSGPMGPCQNVCYLQCCTFQPLDGNSALQPFG